MTVLSSKMESGSTEWPGQDFPPGAQANAIAASSGSGDRIDIHWLLSVFRRRLVLFSSVCGGVILAGIVLTVLFYHFWPTYTGASEVMIDSRQVQLFASSNAPAAAQQVAGGPSTDTAAVATQVEVLKSRDLADSVTRALDLDHDPEFAPSASAKSFNPLKIFKDLLGLTPPPVSMSKEQRARMMHDAVIDRVMSKLDVEQNGTTYAMTISFKASNANRAADIANMYAQLYVADSLNRKIGVTKTTSDLMGGRVEQLAADSVGAQNALQQYKVAHNLMSASGETGSTLVEQEIAGYDQQLATARAEAAEDQARLHTAQDQLRRGSNGEDVGETLNSAVVQSLRAQRVQISGRVADYSSRYGPDHPELVSAQRQLADVDAQIRAEIGRIISNLQAKVQVSTQRVASLEASLGRAQGVLAQGNRAAAQQNILQQRADTAKGLYDDYLGRLKGISTQQGTEQSDARVVSVAEIPTGPSSPMVPLWIALSVLLGLLFGVVAMFTAETLDPGLATAGQLEQRLGLPYLGGVPDLASVAPRWRKRGPIDFIIANPLSLFAEAFRNLRASLEYDAAAQAQVIALVSALSGEGKTTTAVCLAHVAAIQGARVVLVDCDLRRRSVARALKITPQTGLLEVLAGKAPLEKALLASPDTGACFLPLSAEAITPKDVFGGEAMDRLLAELRKRFDLILFDTAPLLAVADARALASKSDAVVLLARWRKTPEHAVRSALRFLSGPGMRIAGVILTRVDMRKQAKYGYGDPGFYFQEYRKYFNA